MNKPKEQIKTKDANRVETKLLTEKMNRINGDLALLALDFTAVTDNDLLIIIKAIRGMLQTIPSKLKTFKKEFDNRLKKQGKII